ncbi:MAG: Gfo/Idh/MocA family oxidoreductase [Ignavibacteriales bacterium]|nr:Gfo/Idh/MocA family oxidoreductase [Ignavibacteriales bacterium]
MKKFAMTGVAGYIAPRHLKAIKDTNNELIAALDPHDSVGILDSYFPNAKYFKEFERFDRHLEKIKRNSKQNAIDYLTICSPNYLHDAHIRFALRTGADAICEKPLVLNPWNIDALQEIENETGRKVYNILQLREHEAIIALKDKISSSPSDHKHDIMLTYITTRGQWYDHAWKGDIEKSGGVATNIGVHFFDMLSWIFGKVQKNNIYLSEPRRVSGLLELENANVRWFLSLDTNDLPEEVVNKGIRTYRSLSIDDAEFNFSDGFTELHTKVYESILEGKGYGLDSSRQSIEIVHDIRNTKVNSPTDYAHPNLVIKNSIVKNNGKKKIKVFN